MTLYETAKTDVFPLSKCYFFDDEGYAQTNRFTKAGPETPA